MSGGSVYATSVVLWAFNGDFGLDFIVLKVYLSDGSNTIEMGYNEYEVTAYRKAADPEDDEIFPDGYYRFSVDSCYHNGETITFEEIWTDWYWLTSRMEFSGGGYPY